MICQSNSTEMLSKVTDRGRPALQNYCMVREWPVLSEIMSSSVSLTVFIHSSCTKRFTRLTTSEKTDSDNAVDKPHKQLRSADVIFESGKRHVFCVRKKLTLNMTRVEREGHVHWNYVLPFCVTVLNEQMLGP